MIILDAKTDYSFMRGFGTPEQWLKRCKDVGVTVLGIADYCSTWGHLPFKKAFKDSGVKLLYGVQLPVVIILDKDPRHSLVTLIAKDNTDELYEAVTTAQRQMYYRPRLTWRQVSELKDCFVIVNECLSTHANAVPKHAYIGHDLMLPDHMPDRPQVLGYGPCYPAPEDHVAFELMQAISENHRLGEYVNDKFHLLRASERDTTFYRMGADVLDNTDALARACTAEPPRGSLLDMGPSLTRTHKQVKLRGLAYDGAKRLGLLTEVHRHLDGDHYGLPEEYEARLEHELETIAEKEFEDYFFFVHDLISWAKQHMLVGPGRGSAGGSLLCYLLGITTVDPLKFGTLFERFIDVTRSDLPDIDIDFPDVRREEVFDYLKKTYGAERFARLGTLTQLGGKSALNSVARATDVPFMAAREVGKWTEGGVQGKVIPPKWIFENVEDVQGLLKKYPTLRMAGLLDERTSFDDDKSPQHISHHGVHASGIVVTNEPAVKYGALTKDGVLTMDMRTAEDIGLVKMDALGLTTLSVIQETCDLIGMTPEKLYDLDWNDQAVFDDIFNSDRVTGIFQFEGHAVRNLMKQVRVDKFDDLCALSSLARPGPLIGGAAQGWVKARNGEAVGEVLHPALEETHGVICYQEQFMYIARDIAGFDVAQVNGMRRAVAKKDPVKLAGFRTAFVDGVAAYYAKVRGFAVDDAGFLACVDDAAELWETICEFGSYAFNKSHAVAYSMISYMTAWLKHNHPLEFAVAQLRNAKDDEQIKNLLRELGEQGYRYVPFDPERSMASWSIIDGAVYGGFDSIHGIGVKTAERMIVAREKGGKKWMESLTDAQRARIEKGETRWVSLSYFSEKYGDLYKDPDGWRSKGIPHGIKPPVFRIKDIPDEKGNFAFVGRILSRNVVDDDSPERVAKRDGKKRGKDHLFINMTLEDDTGEIGATINRFKYDKFRWIADEQMAGRDFLFRGNVIEAGRRWLFIDNIIELVPYGTEGKDAQDHSQSE